MTPPFPATYRPLGWYPSSTYVPEVVSFVGPCPEGHPAQWTERREDCRVRADVVCEACPTHVTHQDIAPDQPERGSDDWASDGPDSGCVRPLAASGAGFTPVEGAA